MHALNRPILLRFKQPVWTGHKWRKCEDKWQELFGSKILFSLQAVNMNYLTDFDTTDLFQHKEPSYTTLKFAYYISSAFIPHLLRYY